MKKIYIIIAIVLVLSLFVGYAAGRGYKTYEVNMEKKMSSEHKSTNNEHDTQNHPVQKELVNPTVYAPKIISLDATKDTTGGYNLKIETSNFKFAPELSGKEVTQNAGHAHVYVNDVKVGRLYANWYYIPDSFFTNGTNTISVTLNANNHNVWWSKKGTLEARANIEVSK